MPREMNPYSKRPRISVDVPPEMRRRLRLAAAKKDVTMRHYLLGILEDHLRQDLLDLEEQEGLLALSAQADPVLADLWDNKKDADYDKL